VAGGRRRWGWHQLDPEVARELVRLAGLPPRSLVLDVGAGLGALTGPLVEAGHRVVALELHPARAAELRRRFGARVRVARADAADLRLPRRPFHVVANPPFAVTSLLLRRLLHPGSRMASATLLLEAAAAHRWAGPTAPAASRWHSGYDVALGPAIPRRSFDPPAAVAARVLLLRRRPVPGTSRR
jgi:23S rRNA (adenine-N6)-dimethyltransferase